jgi:hypothetical protein
LKTAQQVLLGNAPPVETVADPAAPTEVEAKSLALAIL